MTPELKKRVQCEILKRGPAILDVNWADERARASDDDRHSVVLVGWGEVNSKFFWCAAVGLHRRGVFAVKPLTCNISFILQGDSK